MSKGSVKNAHSRASAGAGNRVPMRRGRDRAFGPSYGRLAIGNGDLLVLDAYDRWLIDLAEGEGMVAA